MQSWKKRIAVGMLAITTGQAWLVSDAQACCLWDWLHGRCCFRGGNTCSTCAPTAVGYAPACPTCVGTPQPACSSCQSCQPCAQPCAPACQPCMTTQRVCTYCPQTCYQTAYRQVPVTVYRPVTACDPCTGCPVTTMQACTTTTVQAYRVPVTTYRQVCRDVTVPVAQAAPVMMAQPQFAPAPQVMAPSGGCASCGVPAAPAQTFVAPQPAPTYATPTPQLGGPMVTPIPGPSSNQFPTTTPAPTGGQTAPEYQIPTLPQSQPQSQIPQSQYGQPSSMRSTEMYQPRVPTPELRPLPDLERTNERVAPPLLTPNPNDRTAQREVVPAGANVQIQWATQRTPAPVMPAVMKTDGGWRPSR